MGYCGPKYKLPLCLLPCRSLKELTLEYFDFNCPANTRCIFPGLISLDLYGIEFHGNGNGLVNTNLPKLENLAFLDGCVGNFLVSAPQLQSLDARGCVEGVTIRLLALHLISINSLCLSAYLFSDNDVVVASAALPIAKNLREIVLLSFSFDCGNHLTFLIHLLKKSPKLRSLKIHVEAASQISPLPSTKEHSGARLLGRRTEAAWWLQLCCGEEGHVAAVTAVVMRQRPLSANWPEKDMG
ncbi:unnamed protein product, partial [Cuscuta europaea]